MTTVLWTIGHSTRTIENFLALLDAHGIRTLVDVRRFPGSRRSPHFSREALGSALSAAGIAYRPLPELGGRRTPTPDSPNAGWRNAGFRGYADHMRTPDFQEALSRLMRIATDAPTAIMCAEAVPWRCHRFLIADALTVRRWDVRHIVGPHKADPHGLTSFAKVSDGILTYPAAPSGQTTRDLFDPPLHPDPH